MGHTPPSHGPRNGALADRRKGKVLPVAEHVGQGLAQRAVMLDRNVLAVEGLLQAGGNGQLGRLLGRRDSRGSHVELRSRYLGKLGYVHVGLGRRGRRRHDPFAGIIQIKFSRIISAESGCCCRFSPLCVTDPQ